MFWFPEAVAAIMESFQTVASGISGQDQAYRDWQDMMTQYRYANKQDEGSSDDKRVTLWIVIALPGGHFSEMVEWHEDLPMFMPASGTGKLSGVALTKEELDKMVTLDKNNVHLTYKVKIQGRQAWRKLLEFLATHDMLEKEA